MQTGRLYRQGARVWFILTPFVAVPGILEGELFQIYIIHLTAISLLKGSNLLPSYTSFAMPSQQHLCSRFTLYILLFTVLYIELDTRFSAPN